MLQRLAIVAVAVLGWASSAGAHEIRYARIASTNPYAPYAFLIGDWNVADTADAKPFVKLKFQWAPNRAYILSGAYIGQTPHFEGVMMWNGVHHNLDVLISTDMQRGLAQERGTMSFKDGAVVQDAVASYSEGVSGGGPAAGPDGATQRTRETLRPIDANHIALKFEVETSGRWQPMMPGADHLMMTRTSP